MGKPFKAIFSEFLESVDASKDFEGDVKYVWEPHQIESLMEIQFI